MKVREVIFGEIADLTKKDLTLIPPYDDPDVIAGQGAVAKEGLEQCPDVDLVFVPIEIKLRQ